MRKSRTIRFSILVGLMALLAILLPGSATATNMAFQVVSDGHTHTIVGGSPAIDTTDEGCHKTDYYQIGGASSFVSFSARQKVVFCVWLGVKNDIYSTYATDEPYVAVKWRCYDDSGNPVVCLEFFAYVNLHVSSSLTFTTSFGCTVGGTGGWSRCMGYSGSGTYTNNTGWMWSSSYTPAVVWKGYGMQDLWPNFYGYTTDEWLGNAQVGSASTLHWDVYDTF